VSSKPAAAQVGYSLFGSITSARNRALVKNVRMTPQLTVVGDEGFEPPTPSV
jgi:hypothetical protein